MKLGNYAHISISVSALHTSRIFYERLGLRKIWTGDDPNPWVLMTDGIVNIHLYESHFPSPVLHYFSSDMESRVKHFESLGVKLERQRSRDGKLFQHIFYDPNDQEVTLIPFSDSEMPMPSGESSATCGKFGELSISTDDLSASVEFWERFEFREIFGSDSPYPWTTISDGIITIGLHQRKGFLRTTLSYFAADMDERIQRLKGVGITCAHEFREADGRLISAILESPDKQMMFLFPERI